MRYSYEYKRECVELYRQGRWPATPDGIKDPENFHGMIRRWARMEEANGAEVLKHKGQNKAWKAGERLELVSKVLAGASIASVAIDAGISRGLLYQWVRKYKTKGYNGLAKMKSGQASKEAQMKNLNYNHPRDLNESEYEELIRLRAENAYIKAEIEVIKKEIALREEKEAARLKAKKQRSSKNSVKTDIS